MTNCIYFLKMSMRWFFSFSIIRTGELNINFLVVNVFVCDCLEREKKEKLS